MGKQENKIETYKVSYILLNNVVVSIEYDNVCFYNLKVESGSKGTKEVYLADNLAYLNCIDLNKKEIKEDLKEKGLYEKGVIKAIKELIKYCNE